MRTSLLLFITLITISAKAQRGRIDSVQIRSNRIVNTYTHLLSDAPSGSNSILVADAALKGVNRFNDSLRAGELLLIIQMQGAQISGIEGPDWGAVTDYQGAGNQEWAEVKEVMQDGNIRLNCNLQYSYKASGRTQVIRVPRYKSVHILPGGQLTAEAWNGQTGGVLAIECNDSLHIAPGAKVDVSSLGFRGGVAFQGNPGWGVQEYASGNDTKGAEKGEGIAGYGADYQNFGGRYCRGAAANAGGGGNAHNCGGGGGANGGLPAAWTGQGNPDTSNSSWKQAWELESAGFSMHSSDGGGRGGYSFSGVNNNALTVAPGTSSWDGDWRRNHGGLGGRPLDDSAYRLFAGGGGGAGDANDNAGGSGGRGGGIIAIRCFGTLSGNGAILANGGNGSNAGSSSVNGKDGAGGGGAGGSILLDIAHPLNGIVVEAKGGSGGNQDVFPLIYEGEGPGGGGGGGRVLMPASASIPDLSGGKNGTTDSWGLGEFPSNGATSGGRGSLRIRPLLTGLQAKTDSICGPGMARFIALPADGQEVFWTDKPGGIVLASGDTLQIAVNGDTTLFLNSCYPPESIPVKLSFSEAPVAYAGADTLICAGTAYQLHGSGNGTLHWSGEGILNPYDPEPIVYPETDSWYVLRIQNKYACNSIDSVLIQVKEMSLPQPGYEQVSNYEVVFRADSIPGNQYTWMVQNTLLSGDSCRYNYPNDGDFEAGLIVQHECGNDTLYFPVKVVKIAYNGPSLIAKPLVLFPNPAHNELNFSSGDAEMENYRYQILDASGRIIQSGSGIFGNINRIQLNACNSGIYLMEIRTDKYIYRSTFINQH